MLVGWDGFLRIRLKTESPRQSSHHCLAQLVRRVSHVERTTPIDRRRFLRTAAAAAGTAAIAPTIIPSSALGKDGAVAPSERIVLGGIGIGNRGTYDLGCFLEQKDVQFVAVCDVKEARRQAVKKTVDRRYGNQELRIAIAIFASCSTGTISTPC